MTQPDRSPFPQSSFSELAQAEPGHWWFRARNQLLMWVLARHAPRLNDFLEVGCGTGFVLQAVGQAFPKAKLYGSDFYEEGLEFARHRVPAATFRQLDATKMQEISLYDAIGAFDVIEHIDADEKALENLAAALRPGATLALTVPQHPWLWSRADNHACHVRRYTRAELVTKVRRTGLHVAYVTSFVSLLVPLMWVSRLRANRDDEYDPMSEFRIPGWLNAALALVMHAEFAFIRAGIRFPFGGSLLLVAQKHEVTAEGGRGRSLPPR